jgi:hypothetical protein
VTDPAFATPVPPSRPECHRPPTRGRLSLHGARPTGGSERPVTGQLQYLPKNLLGLNRPPTTVQGDILSYR